MSRAAPERAAPVLCGAGAGALALLLLLTFVVAGLLVFATTAPFLGRLGTGAFPLSLLVLKAVPLYV
jgi:hypothetical protein